MKCQNCGAEVSEQVQAVKPFKNAMNHYVRKSDGKYGGIFNDDAKEIKVGPTGEQEVYILESLYAAQAKTAPITPSPEVQKPITVTPKAS